ncbi:MAG: purine-nucleoside phosphorylase [Firmicutes bacterium]|nr:purine-nucleoside phosphorylase [Candidatus Colivicinus equi]
MSTPHNQAEMGDIAKTVLMPGDPLRAKFIAETFLENPVQFNSVRNIFGYTGTYNGKKLSVMASGMGIPSIGIYSHELFTQYGVECIIRIGSAGAYYKDLKIYDVVLATGAYSDSTYAVVQSDDHEKIQYPSKELNDNIIEAAKKLNIEIHPGLVHSSDAFYSEAGAAEKYIQIAKEAGVVCAEMESFGLFHNAKVLGKKAACLLTISDNLETKEETTHEERRVALINMIKIALEAVKE